MDAGKLSILSLLQRANLCNASDIHIGTCVPPVLRTNGGLVSLDLPALSVEETRTLLYQLLTPGQQGVLEERRSVDCAVSFKDIGRYRVHVYYQRGCLSGAIRKLSDSIPSLDTLGLPPAAASLANLKMGLVLVTGATGSGKSTTLASIIDLVNTNYSHNIITIEDPIEYVHYAKNSIINQRELYSDVPTFPDALRGALRADPDVILVGEMRDLDTIRTAIMAAETGHLVFSTLHSRDAASSINRIIGAFPPEEQLQIRQQLSVSLKAVISQQLLARVDQPGRVLASELMIITPAISNLIRIGKTEHIYMSIETGTLLGMQTMEKSLVELYRASQISLDVALNSAKSPDLIRQRLTGTPPKSEARKLKPSSNGLRATQ
ncbi:MAG: type IV pilus twitching motility protein PilT [Clostridiales bacterium]|jgi:twitching motility protein PilT|nr:type IV pilus twitching motility protein PilT [Clostridiales bacterium]